MKQPTHFTRTTLYLSQLIETLSTYQQTVQFYRDTTDKNATITHVFFNMTPPSLNDCPDAAHIKRMLHRIYTFNKPSYTDESRIRLTHLDFIIVQIKDLLSIYKRTKIQLTQSNLMDASIKKVCKISIPENLMHIHKKLFDDVTMQTCVMLDTQDFKYTTLTKTVPFMLDINRNQSYKLQVDFLNALEHSTVNDAIGSMRKIATKNNTDPLNIDFVEQKLTSQYRFYDTLKDDITFLQALNTQLKNDMKHIDAFSDAIIAQFTITADDVKPHLHKSVHDLLDACWNKYKQKFNESDNATDTISLANIDTIIEKLKTKI